MPRQSFLRRLSLAAFVLSLLPAVAFARGRDAQIVHLKGDVHVLGPNSQAVAAAPDLKVEQGSTIQTGAESWVELRFDNLGCARLGPDSQLSFQNGSRRISLKQGSALLQMPKGAHGARIDGDGNSAVVAGTTALYECHPNVFKFLVLEGTVRFFRPGHLGDSVLLPPGRMIIGQPGTALSDPVDFDIGRFVASSRFIKDFAPLESLAQITRQAQKQDKEKAKGILQNTNLAIFGGGTSVSVLDPAKSPAPPDASGAATPPPPQPRDVAPPPVDRIPTGR